MSHELKIGDKFTIDIPAAAIRSWDTSDYGDSTTVHTVTKNFGNSVYFDDVKGEPNYVGSDVIIPYKEPEEGFSMEAMIEFISALKDLAPTEGLLQISKSLKDVASELDIEIENRLENIDEENLMQVIIKLQTAEGRKAFKEGTDNWAISAYKYEGRCANATVSCYNSSYVSPFGIYFKVPMFKS